MKRHNYFLFIIVMSMVLISAYFLGEKMSVSSDAGTQKPRVELFKEMFPNAVHYSARDYSSLESIANVRVNNMDGVSEPQIAVNPANSSNIAVGCNDFRIAGNQARLMYSFDKGRSWTSTIVPLSGIAGFTEATDPSIAFDAQGNLFYAIVHYQSVGNGDGVFVNRSQDGGRTWNSTATEVKKNNEPLTFEDRPVIFVNNQNTVLVVWTSIVGSAHKIYFSKSIDNAATFSSPKEIASGNVNLPDVKSDANGNVLIAYLANSTVINFVRSNDGGNTFSQPVTVSTFEHSGTLINNHYLLKQNGTAGIKVTSYPKMAVDLSKGTIFIVYSAKYQNDLSDIFITRSIDNGANWSAPSRINSDNTTNDQFMPAITIKNSQVYVLWQDSRDDANNNAVKTYLGVSSSGNLFDNLCVSTSAFNPTNILLNNYIGDYNGIAAGANEIYGIWTDGRSNLFDVYSGIIPFTPNDAKSPEFVASTFTVEQNYPNPFNPSTVISYSIPKDGAVLIQLYDVNGRLVSNLLNSVQQAGHHTYRLNMQKMQMPLSSGAYIYKVSFGSMSITKKLQFIK